MSDSPSQMMTGSRRSIMTGSVVNSIDHERRNTMSRTAARMSARLPAQPQPAACNGAHVGRKACQTIA